MKVFILEDDKERIDFLVKWVKTYIDHKADIYLAKTFAEACDVFENHDYFDFMLLDHDLLFFFMPSDELETGYQVALAMRNGNVTYGGCIIHSLNPEGALKMQKLLPNSICIPISALGFKYDKIKFERKRKKGDLLKRALLFS